MLAVKQKVLKIPALNNVLVFLAGRTAEVVTPSVSLFVCLFVHLKVL